MWDPNTLPPTLPHISSLTFPYISPYLPHTPTLFYSSSHTSSHIFRPAVRCNIPFCSYANRLHKLGVKSLEYRRLQFDIILMFKIYHKLSDLHIDNYFEHCDRKYDFCSHNFKIKSKFCTNTERFRNFFFIRIINV